MKMNHKKTTKILSLVLGLGVLLLMVSPVTAGGGGGDGGNGNDGGQSSSSQPVELDVTVNPTTVMEDENVEVSIGLLAQCNVCDPVVTRRPLDIFLLIDGSGSMADSLGDVYGGTKLEGALEAVNIFLNNVDPSLDRVGIITFNSDATVISELTDLDSARTALNDTVLVGQGSTDTAGFKEAESLFNKAKRLDASQVVILLSDGIFSTSSVSSQAEQLKKNGIDIFTIGLGPEVNHDLLRGMATKTSDYYYAPETSELSGIYQSIAQSIQIYNTATDVIVTLTFDKTNFDLVDNSIYPGGKRGVDTVTWVVDHITAGEQQMFRVNLNPRISGNFVAVKAVNVSYKLCGQTPTKLEIGERFPVDVVGAGGTISDACLRVSNDSKSPLDLVCGFGIPWMWVGFGLVGLALVLKWLKDYGNAFRAQMRCHIPMGVNPWFKLLFYISLALFAGMLLSCVSQGVCTPKSGILFWRILPDGRSSYYVKSTQPDIAARPLTDLENEANRVGFFNPSEINQSIVGVFGGISNQILSFDFAGNPTNTIPSLNGSYPAWSPDGTKVAYAYNNEDIYIYDLTTGKNEPLQGASEPGVIETMLAWNSDGSKIAFVHTTTGISDTVGTALDIPCDIWVVSSAGGSATMLPGASGLGFNYYPAYSPDGKWLAFVHHTDGTTTDDDPNADVYVIPAEGGLPRAVSNTNDDNGDTMPTWSKDSTKVMFSSRDCGNQYDIFFAGLSSDGMVSQPQLMSEISDTEAFEYLAKEADFSFKSILANFMSIWPYLLAAVLFGLLQALLGREKTVKSKVEAVDIEYFVDPEIGKLAPGKSHDVTVSLSGKRGYGKRKYVKSVDVVLLLDRSGSMSEKDAMMLRSRLDAAKKASTHFARCVMTPNDRVGVVCFGDEAQVLQGLTSNYKEIVKKINTITIEGATNMTAGIESAHELFKDNGRQGVKQVIILLSDGGTTELGTVETAEAARKDGIRIFTIGTGDADKELLKQISGDPGDFQFVSDYQDLEKTFMEAARYLKTKVVGRNVTYTCKYAYEKVELMPGTILPRPIKMELGSVTWNFPELIEEKEKRFHFAIRTKVEGDFDVITGGDIDYE